MRSMLVDLLFPPKCHFCRAVLTKSEQDLCCSCRRDAPEFSQGKRSLTLIAHWTAVWYYSGKVPGSIRRFKFYNARGYADFYARELAVRLQQCEFWGCFDMLTWVPVSPLRRFLRGYDQAELLATALGKELGIPPVRLLKKTRHTTPQSNIRDAARRRANVMGAYCCENKQLLPEAHILLVDDVITTGATGEECAKTLLVGGAKQVYLATVATTAYDKKSR